MARQKPAGIPPIIAPPDQVLPLIKEVVRLERELGRPICAHVVWGHPCTFEKGHDNPLHSGDFEHGRGDAGSAD